MLRRGIAAAFAVVYSYSWSQDIHFSQVATNQMLSNPAAAGVFDGWERITVNHKNQWVNAGTKFFTSSMAADLNLFKPKRGNKAHIGLGFQFYNDIGGDSKFGTKQFILNASGIVPLNEMHEISGGIQFGVAQRTGNLGSLVFSNQFNGTVLDPTLNSNEPNNMISFMYPDVGVGVTYRYGNHSIGFSRDHQTDLMIGVAYLHANRPKLAYSLGYSEKLYSKLAIQVNFLKDFSGSKLGMEGFVYQWVQGPHWETLLGALLRVRLSSGSKTTGLNRDAYFKIGTACRIKDALAPMMHIQFSNFDFGVSYDVTISKLGQTARSGGLEFSFIYTNRDFALFKRRGGI